jgi:DNA-binding response OmpR family regulator
LEADLDLASSPGRPAHHDDRYRVLVVDDDGTTLEFLQTLLARNGWNVRTVSETAAIRTAIDAHAPDVVLLDVMLPGGNGFDICRALKDDPATRLTPIVLITGLSDPQSRITGREAGADDFLNNPVDIQELLARVRTLARLKRYTDDLDSASAIIMTLTEMIELRDGYTKGHSYRMANYATALGRHHHERHDGSGTRMVSAAMPSLWKRQSSGSSTCSTP